VRLNRTIKALFSYHLVVKYKMLCFTENLPKIMFEIWCSMYIFIFWIIMFSSSDMFYLVEHRDSTQFIFKTVIKHSLNTF